MSDDEPEKKKRKSCDVDASSKSWRARSIERFGLGAAPDGWKDSVAVGSEGAWRRYYKYRNEKEESDPRNDSNSDGYNSDGDSIDDDCNWERDAMQGIIWSWTDEDFDGMGRLAKLMEGGCKWQWTPRRPSICWEEEEKIRSVDYTAHVWSPYAIPHAIKLSHSWQGKVRWEGYEMATDWSFQKLDFEDDDVETTSDGWEEICSNNYDEIQTANLNIRTCNGLRSFLYGSKSEQSKKITCSDRDFLLLLFGSMGSFDKDLTADAKGCSLGYSWCPWEDKDMKKRLFNEKAPENDEPNGEPPKTLERYNPRWCSWLRYKILEATDSLGPISKHYKSPSKKKPSAYDDSDINDDCDY